MVFVPDNGFKPCPHLQYVYFPTINNPGTWRRFLSLRTIGFCLPCAAAFVPMCTFPQTLAGRHVFPTGRFAMRDRLPPSQPHAVGSVCARLPINAPAPVNAGKPFNLHLLPLTDHPRLSLRWLRYRNFTHDESVIRYMTM